MDVQVYWAAPPLKRLVLNTPPPPTPAAVAMVGGRVGSFVRGGEPYLRTRGIIVSRSVRMARYPRGSDVAHPLLSLELAGNQINPFDAVIHKQESSPHKRFFVGCSSLFSRPASISRRFALGASNVCLVGEDPRCSVPAL